MLAGLWRALSYRPTHVMVLDADDCVSNRLARLVAEHPDANGWYIAKGYFYREGMNTVHVERRRFHKWCGSSHIARPEFWITVRLCPKCGSAARRLGLCRSPALCI